MTSGYGKWTRISLSGCKSLGDVFQKYFPSFYHCVKAAKLSHEAFKAYPGYECQPVKVMPTDNPLFLIEDQRALNDYYTLSILICLSGCEILSYKDRVLNTVLFFRVQQGCSLKI